MPRKTDVRDIPRLTRTVVVIDVDGTVSPVHGATAWGDDVHAGHVFGPVEVSPALCARLDALAGRPGVACCWLTSWTRPMRAAMTPFPGPDWPVIADGDDISRIPGRRWWKLTALTTWLEHHPQIDRVAWCDDHLAAPARRGMVRRELEHRGLLLCLIAPQTKVGLTPDHLTRLEAWTEPPT